LTQAVGQNIKEVLEDLKMETQLYSVADVPQIKNMFGKLVQMRVKLPIFLGKLKISGMLIEHMT